MKDVYLSDFYELACNKKDSIFNFIVKYKFSFGRIVKYKFSFGRRLVNAISGYIEREVSQESKMQSVYDEDNDLSMANNMFDICEYLFLEMPYMTRNIITNDSIAFPKSQIKNVKDMNQCNKTYKLLETLLNNKFLVNENKTSFIKITNMEVITDEKDSYMIVADVTEINVNGNIINYNIRKYKPLSDVFSKEKYNIVSQKEHIETMTTMFDSLIKLLKLKRRLF